MWKSKEASLGEIHNTASRAQVNKYEIVQNIAIMMSLTDFVDVYRFLTDGVDLITSIVVDLTGVRD